MASHQDDRVAHAGQGERGEPARKGRARTRLLAACGVVPALGVAAWALWSSPQNVVTSLAKGVSELEKNKDIAGGAQPLVGGESGSFLGHVVVDGEMKGACYRVRNPTVAETLSKIEIRYKGSGDVKADFGELPIDGTVESSGESELVIKDLTIHRGVGVFDPLSTCPVGDGKVTNEVIDWELRAGSIKLGSKEGHEVDLVTKLTERALSTRASGHTKRETEASGVVIAYRTQTYETEKWRAVTEWSEAVVTRRPRVNLPNEVDHGLSLNVSFFDRTATPPLIRLSLSGRGGVVARCGGQESSASDFEMGLNESCLVDLSDTSHLRVRTELTEERFEIETAIFKTTRHDEQGRDEGE